MSLKGNVVVITGSNVGIGLETAVAVAAQLMQQISAAGVARPERLLGEVPRAGMANGDGARGEAARVGAGRVEPTRADYARAGPALPNLSRAEGPRGERAGDDSTCAPEKCATCGSTAGRRGTVTS